MLKTVLIAVDGSTHATKAVEIGCGIAAPHKAKVIFLHVVKGYELPEGLREFAEAEHIKGPDIKILKRAALFLAENAEQRARDMGIEDTVVEVEEGPIARTIVARAEHHGADMIVVGSRGMGSLERTLR
jgi:nucleotide-binding universal stress UspA family protein